jgi:hypothetical protein
MDFLPLILYPCYRSLEYSLSHQRLYFRWPTQELQQQQQWGQQQRYNQNVNPPPPPPPTLEQVLVVQAQMFQTMQQTMVNMQTAQPQVSPPPSRDRLGDFWHTKPPTFSHALEPWMLTIGSSPLRRSCKWYSATTVRRCWNPLTSSQVLQPTGGMLMLKPLRNPRASTGRNSELLSVHIMFPNE